MCANSEWAWNGYRLPDMGINAGLSVTHSFSIVIERYPETIPTIQIIVGWSVARFGLFGWLAATEVEHNVLNYIGMIITLIRYYKYYSLRVCISTLHDFIVILAGFSSYLSSMVMKMIRR